VIALGCQRTCATATNGWNSHFALLVQFWTADFALPTAHISARFRGCDKPPYGERMTQSRGRRDKLIIFEPGSGSARQRARRNRRARAAANCSRCGWATARRRAAQAGQLQGEIDELERALQEKTGKRDALLGSAKGQNSQTEGTLHFMTLQIRDILLAVNRGNENALEPWGFNVSVGEAKSPHKQAQAEAKQPAK